MSSWAAGLFEGEGNIYSPNGRNWALVIASVDEDVIDRFAREVECPGNRYKSFTKSGKVLYRWQVGKAADVRRVLTLLLPELGVRRSAKAREALAGLAWSVKES